MKVKVGSEDVPLVSISCSQPVLETASLDSSGVGAYHGFEGGFFVHDFC